MRLECRPLVELNTGCVKVHEDRPNQKRRRVVGKQPPPRVWQKVICPMHNMQSDCLIYVLELACEFLPERKWCRILNKETCEHYDTRTRVVLWNNDAPGLKVEEFLKELLEEVPESLKRLDDPEETEAQAWHRYITMSEFELSVARRYRVPCQLLFFLGCTCNAKVTTKWPCQSVISDSYVRLVGSRSSSCISKESSSITLMCPSGRF